MDIRKLCINCMHEKPQAGGVCPHCGSMGDDYTPRPNHLPPMTPLNGKYLLGKALGQGGFGITYIALDTHLQVPVAIKELFLKDINQRGPNRSVVVSSADRHIFEENRKRFLQEARVLAMFNEQDSEGIVNVKDHFEENGTAYIVMEYLNGITLKEYVKQQGKLSLKEAQEVIESVGHALVKIHEFGVIHKDVGPDNIMVLKGGKVKLLDFGGATNMYQKDTGDIISFKRGYAPPEQYLENGRIGPWTDIYALAATMYYCLTGVKPTDAMERKAGKELKAPSKRGAKLSDKMEAALMQALDLQPGDRYRSVEDFLNALNTRKKGGGKGRWFMVAAVAVVAMLAVFLLGGSPLGDLLNPPDVGEAIEYEAGTYIIAAYTNPEIIVGIDSGFGDDGAKLILKNYKESNRNRISISMVTKDTLEYRLRAAHTNSILMAKDDNTNNGTLVVQYENPDHPDTAKWQFVFCGKENGNPIVILRNSSGAALVPEGGRVADGNSLILDEFDLTDNKQKWVLTQNKKDYSESATHVYHAGDVITSLKGVYTLASTIDGKSMWSISSYAELSEPEVIIWENVWDVSQHFRFELATDTSYRIYPVNQGDNKCLELDPETGKIVVRDVSNTTYQMFTVIYDSYNMHMIQTCEGTVLGFKLDDDGSNNGHLVWAWPYEDFSDGKLAKWLLATPE